MKERSFIARIRLRPSAARVTIGQNQQYSILFVAISHVKYFLAGEAADWAKSDAW
jgi:hypothetical protein